MKHSRYFWLLIILWVSQSFFTIEKLTTFLNALPPDRAASAKIVATNSARSFNGWWYPYTLIYQTELKDQVGK